MTDRRAPDFYEALALMRDAEAEIASFIETCADLINLNGLNEHSRAAMADAGRQLSALAQHLLGCDRDRFYSNRLRELLL